MKSRAFSFGQKSFPCEPPPGYDVSCMRERDNVPESEPKRSFFQTAVHNFFALYLGVTPPAPGKEGLYAALLLAVALCLIGAGYLIVRTLLGQILR